MSVFTIVIMEAPYGRERAYTGLRFALAAGLEGHRVNIFLVQDGVFVAKKGQASEVFPNIVGLLEETIREGAEVTLCTPCCNARGVTKDDLPDGVKMGTMDDLVKWTVESDKILTF